MPQVTDILSAIEQGDPNAAAQLLPLVYDELRKLAAQRLAHERPDQSLDATALVHEAYLRLVDAGDAKHWNSRGHFFAAAAEAMRRILVEQARRRQTIKRGADVRRLAVDLGGLAAREPDEELLALHDALDRLAELHPEKAELVKLRYFAGLTADDAALALGISPSSADRAWIFARAWLKRAMNERGGE